MGKTIIKISRQELLSILLMVGKIVQPNKHIPAAGQFRIEAGEEDNRLTVMGTDSLGTLTASVTCIEVIGRDVFCVDAKSMTDVIRELTEQPLTITITDKGLKLDYFGGYMELPRFDADEFPVMEQLPEAVSLPMKKQTIQEGIAQVVNCAGNDELRPVMNGVFIELKDATLTFVATNAMSLGMREFSYLGGEDVSAIVPVRAAKIMTHFLGACDDEVMLCVSRTKLSIETADRSLIYRLAEGRYPNYRAVIPKNDKAVELKVKALESAIRRVSVLASNETPMMKIDIADNVMTISTEAPKGGTFSKEEIGVSANFDLEIGLKLSETLMLLDSLKSEMCRIAFSDASRAIVITPSDDKDVTMLQMPMLMN